VIGSSSFFRNKKEISLLTKESSHIFVNFIATQDVPVAFPKPKMSKVNQNFDFSQSIPLGNVDNVFFTHIIS
jgi:hypothetical protein